MLRHLNADGLNGNDNPDVHEELMEACETIERQLLLLQSGLESSHQGKVLFILAWLRSGCPLVFHGCQKIFLRIEQFQSYFLKDTPNTMDQIKG